MGLKKAENQVKILLAETILSMCRNTLNYHAEICVEGLLGITLDNEEIFLVNINQTIKNQIETPKTAKDKNLKRNQKDDEGSGSESESSSSESETSQSGRKKRKRPRRKKSKSSNRSESESEEERGNGHIPQAAKDSEKSRQDADSDEEKETKYSRTAMTGNDSRNDPLNDSQNDSNLADDSQYYDNSMNATDSLQSTPSLANVKQEPNNDEDSEDDLVFVKEEIDNYTSCSQPSTHQFSNLSQVFQQPHGDTSMSQPDFMAGAFYSSANSMVRLLPSYMNFISQDIFNMS